MAGKSGVGYARGQWAASDSKWCKFMDEATDRLLESERSDVARATMRVLRHCHSHMWPSEHWARERKSWPKPYDGMAVPAFRVSESSIAEECDISRWRARTAISRAESNGLIVRVAEARPRGEGRGMQPITYTFACYLRKNAKANKPKAKDKPTTTTTTTTSSPKASLAAKFGIKKE